MNGGERRTAVATACVAAFTFQVQAAEVIFAGDSTMTPMRYSYGSDAKTRGSWPDETDDYFPNWNDNVLNYAADGQTMASFKSSGQYELMLREVKPGDFAYLAFGDADEKQLEDFVLAVRERKGVPILGTSVHPEAPDTGAAKFVAARFSADFVDLRALVGKAPSARPDLVFARKAAKAFVDEVRTRKLALAREYVAGEPAKIGRYRWDRRQTIMQRLRMIGGVKADELLLRPTYVSLGFRLGVKPGTPPVQALYRRKGETGWQEAEFPPPYFDDTAEYRGSITGLEEDTEYEVSIGGKKGTFRTWKSDVPIARTVEISADAKFPITIDAHGKPDGWIRYTVRPGTALRRDRKGHFLLVKGAAYVLIDGIVFAGGGGENQEPVRIVGSEHVRVRNCEFTGWGEGGTPDFTDKAVPKVDGRRVNFDAAVFIGPGAKCTTVERCYFHDAYGTSCSWYYAHPAGNEAIQMGRPDHSTVIRWNDFVGSDLHRFNDAVEGEANFWENGGFNCDADIYGNFFVFCNDDNIELDGGQMNVRCFANRFESSLCGVSIQGCMVSPSYVFDNDFTGLGEEQGKCGSFIKPWDFDIYKRHPTTYIYSNRFCGPGLRSEPSQFAPNGFVGGNTAVDDARTAPPRRGYPKRDLPFVLSTTRIDGLTVRGGHSDDAVRTVLMRWCGAKDGRRTAFAVRKNLDADWYDVTPSAGSIGPGEEVKFTVRILPEKMNDRRWYRAAFLVRTPEGLSRCCSLYAATDFVPPYEAVPAGEHAVYLEATKPSVGMPMTVEDRRARGGRCVLFPTQAARAGKEPLVYSFGLPKKGRWWFYLHGTSGAPTEDLTADAGHPRLVVSLDGAPKKDSQQQCKRYMTWTMVNPGKGQGNMVTCWELEAGRHTLVIDPIAKGRCDFRLDGLVATDRPEAFEPR